MNEMTFSEWLKALAAKQPAPGGGAAAGVAAATAAALVGMVSIYTTGEKWAAHSDRMNAVHHEAATLREEALNLIEKDEVAFHAVSAAYKLPKSTDEEQAIRTTAIQNALVAAAEPPCKVAELAGSITVLADELASKGNPSVISDVAVAGSFAKAALESAIDNIVINQRMITDNAVTEKLQAAIDQARSGVEKAEAVISTARGRMIQ